MQHPYSIMKPELDGWVTGFRITRPAAVAASVGIILKQIDFYRGLGQQVGIPGAFLGALDLREDDCDPTRGIGQGDRWTQKSVNVPRGMGPFASRLAADIFYLRYDHMDRPPVPYDLSVMCYQAIVWNGWGYTARGLRSPYVVGATNLQQPGKYVADGKWSGSETDTQVGILPIVSELIRLRPELAFGTVDAAAPPIAPDSPVTQLPDDHRAGSLTGATWVQHSLNVLKAVPPDLAPLAEDGNYGRRTAAAVRAFQTAHGLQADGQAGDETCAAIDAALAALNPAP